MARTIRVVCARLLVLALGGTLLLACRGCQSTSPPPQQAAASQPTRGGELMASLRSEPGTYNRHAEQSAAAALLTHLTHAPLVRINRATHALEPWLAESWTQSPDGQYTLKLRPGVRFSDGTPLTSADVLFSFQTTYDQQSNSVLAGPMRPGGMPIQVAAPDASTITMRIPESGRALGLRLLDSLPILPRHKLESAAHEGRFAQAWRVGTPLNDIAGLGPFVLSEHVAGQRLVFTRNQHYWRRDANGTQLPYLDKLTVLIIPSQDSEALRVEAGEVDVMSNGDIRPEDYTAFKRAADQGKLRLIEAGVGVDPNMLWFNLAPSGAPAKRKPWLLRREFRQAVSYAVDRQAMANTVYLGEAVPIYGPVSPGNKTWYSPSVPAYPYDVVKARELLAGLGLTDRNGDSMLEDAKGVPVRFSLLTQIGHTIRERTAAVVQEQLRQVGIGVDIAALDPQSIFQRFAKGDYESIYFGSQVSETDPAAQAEFWLSSGPFHVWNPGQRTPATEWERRIDDLTRQQMGSSDVAERQRLFAEAQRIFGEELPAIYFVVPKTILAVSRRVVNPQPSVLIPQLLWSADTLGVK